jgi:hypothetical protein
MVSELWEVKSLWVLSSHLATKLPSEVEQQSEEERTNGTLLVLEATLYFQAILEVFGLIVLLARARSDLVHHLMVTRLEAESSEDSVEV